MDPHGQRDSPRRESSGPSRIRKTIGSIRRPPPDEPGSTAAGPGPHLFRAGGAVAWLRRKPRERQDREPYREEGPADREPIRFIREREREPVRERPEREPGLSVRERLARDRAERDGGPIHREESRMARDRDRDRDAAPLPPRAHAGGRTAANFRERPEREATSAPRERDREYHAATRATRTPGAGAATSIFRLNIPRKRKTSSATPRSTIATKTSSAARSISPSFRR